MERINTTNKDVDLFGAGKHGFKDGDPINGIFATFFAAVWCNSVQEELANLVEGAGMALNAADRSQVKKALQLLTAPPSKVEWFARNTAPTGWLKANGAAVSRATYADLFAAIGTVFGVGDGATTFNLPDLRGEFIRGWDDARGVDTGRAFGSAQAHAFFAHSHNMPNSGAVSAGVLGNLGSSQVSGTASSSNTDSVGGTETRPRNVALLACIKY